MTVEEVRSFLRAPSRKPAQFTAPPQGLFLEAVYYQEEEIA
jgi:tRNA U38,U39,U40 pseudouridine synthase TruA